MYSKDFKPEKQVKELVKSLGKDNVGVEIVNGKYRLNISRAYSRMYYGKDQKRPNTGLSVLDSKGKIDKANADTISAKVAQMHNDLANGYFDKTLVKYSLAETPTLEVIDGGKKPKFSLLELYDWYCESKKGIFSETHLEIHLKRDFRNVIVKAINTVGENDAIAIRQYLIENRCLNVTRDILSHLDKAYQLGIKNKEITNNPFAGMAEEINVKKQNKQNDSEDDNEDSDKRAFTIDEMNVIMVL